MTVCKGRVSLILGLLKLGIESICKSKRCYFYSHVQLLSNDPFLSTYRRNQKKLLPWMSDWVIDGLYNLRRARDGASVTHVAFHPLHMKMFMATLDGTLYLMS